MSDWYVNNVNTHRCFIMSMMYARNLVDLQLKYYTDWQDIDEDQMTICDHGGHWNYGDQTGAATRHMYDIHSTMHTHVAYKYNKNSTPVTESRVLCKLFKFVDMSNYEGTMYYCVYRTPK